MTQSQENKGITIRGRDLGIILAFASIIIGGVVDSALTRARVAEHDALLKQYSPAVMYQKQETMADDIGEIKGDVKAMAKAMNDYFKSQSK